MSFISINLPSMSIVTYIWMEIINGKSSFLNFTWVSSGLPVCEYSRKRLNCSLSYIKYFIKNCFHMRVIKIVIATETKQEIIILTTLTNKSFSSWWSIVSLIPHHFYYSVSVSVYNVKLNRNQFSGRYELWLTPACSFRKIFYISASV